MKRSLDHDHCTRSYSLFDEMFDAKGAVEEEVQIPFLTVKDDYPWRTAYYWPFDLETGEESNVHRDMRLCWTKYGR